MIQCPVCAYIIPCDSVLLGNNLNPTLDRMDKYQNANILTNVGKKFMTIYNKNRASITLEFIMYVVPGIKQA